MCRLSSCRCYREVPSSVLWAQHPSPVRLALSSSSTSTYQIVTGKFGRKWTLVAFTAIFSVGAILTTVANEPHNGLALIYAGRVISGFGIGGISAVAPAFVSECSPKDVRGRITGLFQIMVRHIALSFLSCPDLCRRLPSVS